MPNYAFQCQGCGNRFTEAMSIDDHDKRKLECPQCHGQDTEPVIEAPYVATAKKS